MIKTETKKFLLVLPLALLTMIIPCIVGEKQVLSSVLLIIIGILMLTIDFSFRNLIFYFAVLISGPIAEAVVIHFGMWTYTNPAIIGVPIWLFFVWGNAGLYIVRLKEFIFSFNN